MYINKFYCLVGFFLSCCLMKQVVAANQTELAVWANEAIVATYTYDYKNFLAQQKEIAKYFSAQGWVQYSAAFTAAKLLDMVQKNNYFVSAVATMPPEIKMTGKAQWQATMPILVVYKNPQYQQQQNLLVTIDFGATNVGGVRGLAILGLRSKLVTQGCQCIPKLEEERKGDS